jgi:hypothetical protein
MVESRCESRENVYVLQMFKEDVKYLGKGVFIRKCDSDDLVGVFDPEFDKHRIKCQSARTDEEKEKALTKLFSGTSAEALPNTQQLTVEIIVPERLMHMLYGGETHYLGIRRFSKAFFTAFQSKKKDHST